MDNTGTNLVQNAMDHTSPYNPFGVAWTLYNPVAPDVGCPNPPDTGSGFPVTGDISRAGRAIPGGLQVGQTFSTVIANPAELSYYRGYTIVLSTGSGNLAYDKVGTQVAVGTFEFSGFHGRWYTSESYQTGRTPLFDKDTTTNGMQLDITLTSTNTYHLL